MKWSEYMSDDLSNTNIEWKKKTIGKKERVTLKTNVKQANLYQALQKNNLTPLSISAQLPLGLKKIRKKIKDVFDEDDDEDEETISPSIDLEMLGMNNSLLHSLKKDEKQALKTHEQVVQTTQILQANRTILAMGLKGLSAKAVNSNLQKNISTEFLGTEIIKQELRSQKGLKLDKLSNKDFVQALRGIKRLQQFADKESFKDLDLKHIIEIGHQEKNDKEVAELILQKTGRKESDFKQSSGKKSKIKNIEREFIR